ncbi:hypothetical protein K438DRAFT_74855 [Mycena galopus ATCC 62051]|nr:hypothetical protein K438DRAFT_74855 [Mycena galopus ATCC 62051]
MVKIYIEDCDENLTEYEVDLAASVRRLKGEIEETEGNSRWEQCLKFEGRELYDDRSLFSSFIREYSVVQLSANGTGGLGAIEADKRGNARSVREIELELPELRQVYHDIRGGIGGIEGEGGIGSRGAGERERPRSWRKHGKVVGHTRAVWV